MKKKLGMKREVWDIDKIQEAPYNPRKISREMFEKLKNSIKTFEAYTPIMVNPKTGHAIGGNQTLRALRELGYREVEVVLVELALEKEMALNLALNKISGTFDNPSLPVIFQEIMKDQELLNLTGFELPEVFQLIDTYTLHDDEDVDIEEVSEGRETITKKGDLIELGPHKIICDDTTKKETLAKLLGDEKISLLHEDLPYGVEYDSQNRPKDPNKRKQKALWGDIKNDDLVGEKYLNWCKERMANIKPFLNNGAAVYLWSGFRNFGMLTQLLMEMGFHVANVITWVKPSACPGFSDYSFASEFLLYAWLKDGGSHKWYGAKNESNVWKVDHDEACGRLHPTAKPVALARRVLKNSSQKGDIVFDGCMGAGFNLIACQQMGRIFRGGDIETLYIDRTIKRYIRTFGVDSVSQKVRDKYFGRVKNVK